MKRLGPSLDQMGLTWQRIDGPNMEDYCPGDINDDDQNQMAGKHLMLGEWDGTLPDVTDIQHSDLGLSQMAVFCGHMRAWRQIVETGSPALILEDDAEIGNPSLLKTVLEKQSSESDVVLFDKRHCLPSPPPHLVSWAPGLTAYWIDVKTAQLLLGNVRVNQPVDWYVNDAFNKDVKAVCATEPEIVREFGGEKAARHNSAARGCHRDLP
eukprot:TRINITY_DN13154_c0_g1_i1.p1 TRINITY_DN13154_c0_g1~~TRINITY_DN13154_c0_g1_i1.p1  ORF type:complete len:210 (-),score=34.25 TRINITY_DN13154_c0_g1_i1:131-760(-)